MLKLNAKRRNVFVAVNFHMAMESTGVQVIITLHK